MKESLQSLTFTDLKQIFTVLALQKWGKNKH